MDIKAYIESGILEQYVAGWLSEEERQAVIANAAMYPEIKEELDNIEVIVEKLAQSNAFSPKNDVKSKILQQIANERRNNNSNIVSMNTRSNWTRYAVAASTIGFTISVWFNYSLTQRLNSAQRTIADLRSENTKVVQEYDVLRANFRTIDNEETKKILLTGTPNHTESKITIYWQPKSNNVLVSIGQLPQAPDGKQYQLWAIGSNGPVDAGVLIDSIGEIQKMKNINEAVAFAITLEKEGGSPTPNLEEMYAIAKF